MFLRLLFALLLGWGLASGPSCAAAAGVGFAAKTQCGHCCAGSADGCCHAVPAPPQKLPPAVTAASVDLKMALPPTRYAPAVRLALAPPMRAAGAFSERRLPPAEVFRRGCVWLI